ncbi:MAG: hypothetical protein LUH07_07045, partial [Lachnospiraceae bacterium]|nr:hypothetical protein [Lachnospiraceae bacterium]
SGRFACKQAVFGRPGGGNSQYMYQKNPSSIMKHIDFMILDLVCFMISLGLACLLHLHDWEIWESRTYRTYRSLLIIIALVHICMSVFDSNCIVLYCFQLVKRENSKLKKELE